MPTPPTPCLLYHFVHLETLRGVLSTEALLSKNGLAGRDTVPARDIAESRVQIKRARKSVPLGGTLHDYVPFYFAPRSPMMRSIVGRWQASREADPSDLVYLVSSVERVVTSGAPFTFTTHHAVTRPNEFLTDLDDLARIDWPLMAAQYWHDTDEDNDRRRRRQAEFLVRDALPLSALEGFATADPVRQTRVETLVAEHGLDLRGKPRPDWYF